jgi:hypothetical protein
MVENGQLSWYSDRLQAGRPRRLGLIPGREEIFLYFTASSLPLGLTQPPVQWVVVLFPQNKVARA